MASRFAVATGTWNSSNTAIWSASDGGAAGASVPTTSDDVFLTALSGNITVTISGTVSAKSLNCTGFIGTLTGSGATVDIGILNGAVGDVTFSAAMTFSGGPLFLFQGGASGTTNLTMNGQALGAVSMQQSQTISLADDLLVGGNWSQTGNTKLITNDHAITFFNGVSLNASGGSWTLGSSSILVSAGSFLVPALSSMNAGTSQIKIAQAGVTFNGGGKTYHDLWYSPSGASALLVQGSNTFNKIIVDAGRTVQFTAGTTTTLTDFPQIDGTSGNETVLKSSSGGSSWNLSKSSGAVVCNFISLQDSAAAGGATFTANNSINVSGNSGWIFASTSVGSASGTGAAAGIGTSSGLSVGSAAGTGAAAAVGVAIDNSVGSAVGVGAANAVGVAKKADSGMFLMF